MASFTRTHRFAYHVVPLQALRPIWESKVLLSKANPRRSISLKRRTTASVDAALGFERFVHFYLPKGGTIDFSKLSILSAQIGESVVPAFPHVVLVVDTGHLADQDCTVCNFNIAVSRPAYKGVGDKGVGGGNHSRGTSPEKIRDHWRGFRAGSPKPVRLRYGEWVDGLEVPVLSSEVIARSPQHVGHGTKKKVAELLIRDQYDLNEADRFYCFSEFDLKSVARMPDPPPIELAASRPFEWYAREDRVTPEDRRAIEQYLTGRTPDFPAHLDCDRIRPQPKRSKGVDKVARSVSEME